MQGIYIRLIVKDDDSCLVVAAHHLFNANYTDATV